MKHCTKGIGIWDWLSTDVGSEPDVVMASAGDVPDDGGVAAVAILRENFPDLKIRFVNVVDLFKLMPNTMHPHGLNDEISTRSSRRIGQSFLTSTRTARWFTS